MAYRFVISSLAFLSATVLLSSVVSGQIIINPCTPSLITAFMPCMNFATNSSSLNATAAPTADCCSSIKSLVTSGRNCLCLVATGTIPFQIPINRTLAISLPRACNMPAVPFQCKATASAPVPTPFPSPGPVANEPSVSPKPVAPSPTVTAPPQPLPPRSAPPPPPTSTANGGAPDSRVDAPPMPPAPAATRGVPGSRAGIMPSAGSPACNISPWTLVAILGVLALK